MPENQNQGGQFGLERLFVKDLSFEVPNSKVFLGEWKPEMNVQLNTEAQRLDDTHFEVNVTVTVTATNAGSTAFVAEVKQAGIFLIEGVPEAQLTQLAHTAQTFCSLMFVKRFLMSLRVAASLSYC